MAAVVYVVQEPYKFRQAHFVREADPALSPDRSNEVRSYSPCGRHIKESCRSAPAWFRSPIPKEHSVRVPAGSLYEAAIEAMAAFRRGVFAEMPFGPATRLTIRVKAAGGRTHHRCRQVLS